MSEQTTTVILKERDALRAAVIETCPRLVNESDADCLRRTVSELRADLESETRWAKQYHDDWIAAREELSQMKNGRDALAAEREQLLDYIASLARAALKIEAALGAAIDQRNEAERFVNENYDLIGYWRDLFKCANAAKRKARRMRGCCGRMG